MQFRRLVLRARDEVRPIETPLQIRDGRLVHVFSSVDLFPCDGVPLRQRPVLVPRDYVLVHWGEARDGRFGFFECDGHARFLSLLRIDIDLDIEDDNRPQIPHALLRHAQQLRAVLRELDALDRRGEIPCPKTFSGADFPELDRVVGGARGEERGAWVDGDGPEGALVPFVGS